LKENDIRVVVFSGERRKGVMGIEFEVEVLGDAYFLMHAPEPLA